MQVTLTSPQGDTLDLTSDGAVFVPEGALTTLVGSVSRSDTTVPGRHGARPGKPVVQPIQTTVDFYLHTTKTTTMPETYARFYDFWDLDRDTVLEAHTDHPLSPLFLTMRLHQTLPGLRKDKRDLDELTVPVQVFAKDGVFWTEPDHRGGTVTLTNTGDVTIHPEIRWTGPGGTVTTPSQATFTLPPVAAPRRVLIDAGESCVVLDDQGVRDDALSAVVSPQVFPEATPKRMSSTWVLPDGAELWWRTGILNPWR